MSPGEPPPLATTRRVPVAFDATETHSPATAGVVCWVHVRPASAEVQMLEPTATSFFPVESEATEKKLASGPAPEGVRGLQVAPESGEVQRMPMWPLPETAGPPPEMATRFVPLESEARETQ
jgi:hypothetical protein